ncbi:alpha/beta hydrolase [Nguyenibacter vanlangensis]|uniref:Alpha/beta hydrolase n=1 Tax=Nguyenibacter vanlangensis TaxID=1216886 RepID=A0ABZ3D968_9PROT
MNHLWEALARYPNDAPVRENQPKRKICPMPTPGRSNDGGSIQHRPLPCRETTAFLTDPTVASALIGALSPFDIVIVPGLDGSGPDHWQSRWEGFLSRRSIAVHRVVQIDWEKPTYRAWRSGLRATLAKCSRPTILIAHSLGAVLVARWASERSNGPVSGAFLVAPADVERHRGADAGRVADFAPLPSARLPFPSVLVASRNDEWLTIHRARTMARRWGSTMLDAGKLGHIGNISGVGLWPDGLSALGDLALSLSGAPDP